VKIVLATLLRLRLALVMLQVPLAAVTHEPAPPVEKPPLTVAPGTGVVPVLTTGPSGRST